MYYSPGGGLLTRTEDAAFFGNGLNCASFVMRTILEGKNLIQRESLRQSIISSLTTDRGPFVAVWATSRILIPFLEDYTGKPIASPADVDRTFGGALVIFEPATLEALITKGQTRGGVTHAVCRSIQSAAIAATARFLESFNK
jgi:hypothetical protein